MRYKIYEDSYGFTIRDRDNNYMFETDTMERADKIIEALEKQERRNEMIIKNEEQTKLEFGNGDISIAGGYTTGDTVKGFVVFENQEAREVGSPGIAKEGEVDLNDYDVVMTFSKKESIDALIEQLELTKTYMSCDIIEIAVEK